MPEHAQDFSNLSGDTLESLIRRLTLGERWPITFSRNLAPDFLHTPVKGQK